MAEPQLIVLFGATGDLAKRKLLPGILHLLSCGLLPDLRLIGVSRHEYDDETFRQFAEKAIREFSKRPIDESALRDFLQRIAFASVSEGPDALAKQAAVYEEELHASNGIEPGRLHY